MVSAAINAIVLAAQLLSQLVVSAKDSPKPDEKSEILAAYNQGIVLSFCITYIPFSRSTFCFPPPGLLIRCPFRETLK